MNITAAQAAKFERIMNLEQAVRIGKAIAAFRGAGVPMFVQERQAMSKSADQARLDAAINELTLDEMQAFGEFRREVLAN